MMKAIFSFEYENMQTWSLEEGFPMFLDAQKLNTSPRGYRGCPGVSPCFCME